jgi:HK97 family phage prohead protease
MERKDNPLAQCQIKNLDDKTGEFEGYASVFNSTDAVNDTILPGAFKQSISETMPKMFVNHDHRQVPVGDWLEMREDDYGLYAVGRIDMNHKDGPTTYSALKRRAMDGLSIGFRMTKDDYEWKENNDGRVIKNMSLFETSIVSYPAEGLARISAVKGLIEAVDDLKSLEAILRDEGFSRAAAIALISRVKQLTRCDSEDELRKTISEYEEQIKHYRSRIATLNGHILALKIGGQ